MRRHALILSLAMALPVASPALAQSGANRAELVPMAGMLFFDDLITGPVGSRLTNADGAVFGAQLGIPIAGPLALYGSGAYSRSTLDIGVPLVGGFSIADTDAFLIDGGLQLRVPTPGRIDPVFQVGAGVMHYRIDAPIVSTSSTSAALTLGAGLDMTITPGLGLRVMAKDYIGKFDFREAAFVNVDGRTGHNLGLVAGLRFSL